MKVIAKIAGVLLVVVVVAFFVIAHGKTQRSAKASVKPLATATAAKHQPRAEAPVQKAVPVAAVKKEKNAKAPAHQPAIVPGAKKVEKAKVPVHKAALAESNNGWQNAVGHVVAADPATNTLIIKSEGKRLKLNVPGRINMLDLKSGDMVSVRYFAKGNRLHLWELNKH